MNKQLKADILTIIDYNWDDEKKDYEANKPNKHVEIKDGELITDVHIFEILKSVKGRLKNG